MVGFRLLLAAACFGHVLATARQAHKYRALELVERQGYQPLAGPPSAFASTTSGVLTVITPSPGATPVDVTSQSQTVTSYVPQITLCALPPVAEVPASVSPRASTAPYRNYSTSYTPSWATDTGTCLTSYSPTVTTVCATTLSGIAEKYTVTSCSQDITFSTQYGYVLATPTAAPKMTNTTAPYANRSTITTGPSIQTLTTYFMAPWQELRTAGPPGDVDLKVCTTYANGTEICAVEFQEWLVNTVSYTTTSLTSINFTTEISGPSQIIFATITANVTETLTTYSLSTTLAMTYTTETETTSTATRAGSVSTLPTVYKTLTVEEASQTSAPTRSTTTLHVTSTIYGGTTTETINTDTATSLPASLDFASILGVGR